MDEHDATGEQAATADYDHLVNTSGGWFDVWQLLRDQPDVLDATALHALQEMFRAGETACDRSIAAAAPPRYVLDLYNGDVASAYLHGLPSSLPAGAPPDVFEAALEKVAPELCAFHYSPDAITTIPDLLVELGIVLGEYATAAQQANRSLYFTEWRVLSTFYLKGLALVDEAERSLAEQPAATTQPVDDDPDPQAKL
jgi:hypothetical protein